MDCYSEEPDKTNMDNYVAEISGVHNTSNLNSSDTWQYRGIWFLEEYSFLFVFILGWITNILAIIVLQDKSYRGTSTGFLMTALALADIGVVSTSAAHIWIKSLLGYDVRVHSLASCKLHMYFTYLTVNVSAWTLALVAVERVVCVSRPFRYRILFSFKRTAIAWSTTAVLLAVLNNYLLWMIGLYVDDGSRICDWTDTFKKYVNSFDILDLLSASMIPFMVILPCNIIIIMKMLQRRVWEKSRRAKCPTSKEQHTLSPTTAKCPATGFSHPVSHITVNRASELHHTSPLTVKRTTSSEAHPISPITVNRTTSSETLPISSTNVKCHTSSESPHTSPITVKRTTSRESLTISSTNVKRTTSRESLTISSTNVKCPTSRDAFAILSTNVKCPTLCEARPIGQSTVNRPTPKGPHPVSSTTVMLIVNCAAFLFLTAPVALLSTWVTAAHRTKNEHDTSKLTEDFLMLLFHLMFNMNSCVNFFLYYVSSRKFRHAFSTICTVSHGRRVVTI